MKRIFVYCLLLIIPFISALDTKAQSISVEAGIDSTMLWIGQQAKLSFRVDQTPEMQVQFPYFSDTIPGGLDIVEPVKIDSTHNSEGRLIIKHDYVVTAFEDSLLYIPSMPFVVGDDTVWSNSLSLKVVQPFELDMESNTIADIKPVYKPRFNWKAFFFWTLLILLVIALVVIIFIFVRKYIQKKPIFETDDKLPDLPPYVVALAALNKIKDEKLWQQGRLKEYFTELTDTIRQYVDGVYGVNAMEMTSDEILSSLAFMRREQKESYAKLQDILKLSDLVKFAKWKPLPNESEQALKNAFAFIEETKPEESIEETNVNDEVTESE